MVEKEKQAVLRFRCLVSQHTFAALTSAGRAASLLRPRLHLSRPPPLLMADTPPRPRWPRRGGLDASPPRLTPRTPGRRAARSQPAARRRCCVSSLMLLGMRPTDCERRTMPPPRAALPKCRRALSIDRANLAAWTCMRRQELRSVRAAAAAAERARGRRSVISSTSSPPPLRPHRRPLPQPVSPRCTRRARRPARGIRLVARALWTARRGTRWQARRMTPPDRPPPPSARRRGFSLRRRWRSPCRRQ